MEDPARQRHEPDKFGAWLLWLTSTVLMPAIAGATANHYGGLSTAMFVASPIAFLFASKLLGQGKLWMILLIGIGGCMLMLVSLLVGCASFSTISMR